MNDNAVHVVMLVYDPSGTYSQHAGVVMTSIFENTHSKVIVHILHDETLTQDNRQKLIRTAERYSQSLDLIDVSEHKKHFTDTATDLARRKCTIGSLYRLFIPELMPKISKVIYLDCDIVVNLDIKEMWDIDVNDCCLAAVHDPMFETLTETVRDWLNGSSSKTFVNAGVMIMNLDMIRQRGNLFNNAMAWIERRVHLMQYSDQDVINNLFYGSIKLIDPKFNNCNPATEEALSDSIIHTPIRDERLKIWSMSKLPSQRLYWKHYVHSAWGEDTTPEELTGLLYNASSPAQIYRRESYLSCLIRVIRSPYRRVLLNLHILQSAIYMRVIIVYIIKDVYYRLKYKFTH